MGKFIGGALFGLIGLALVAVGVNTLWHIRDGKVLSFDKMAPRTISRRDDPVGFWMTMFTGLLWLLFGMFLLALPVGFALGV
jgi:hypothetical protein